MHVRGKEVTWLCRVPVKESHALGYAWSLVQAAAGAYNAWVRSVASAVGGVHLKRTVDPLGDLSIGRGGAAAFRSQVHIQSKGLNFFVWLRWASGATMAL